MIEQATEDEVREALVLARQVRNLRNLAKRRALAVSEASAFHSHVCRICGVCRFRRHSWMIQYGVRHYACTECFISADATSVLVMPSHVINGIPLCDFDSFKVDQLSATDEDVRNVLVRVWKGEGRHAMLDVEALHRWAEAHEAAVELLRGGRAAAVLAGGEP